MCSVQAAYSTCCQTRECRAMQLEPAAEAEPPEKCRYFSGTKFSSFQWLQSHLKYLGRLGEHLTDPVTACNPNTQEAVVKKGDFVPSCLGPVNTLSEDGFVWR